MFVGLLFYGEYSGSWFAPTHLVKAIQDAQKPKPVQIILTDKFQEQKGGSLFVGVYNVNHYLGHDVNGTNYHFTNDNNLKYHEAKINQTLGFTCYADWQHCD